MNDDADHNKLPQPETRFSPKPELEPELSRASAAGIGLGLFIFFLLIGVVTYGVGFIIGLAVVTVSLFYPGYRYIFIGFILSTLVTLGVLFLVLIEVCSNMHI